MWEPGLAGASAAASLAEMDYNVKVFVLHDSPRRAHSIAAQGGRSMRLKTIKMTEILSKGFFMTPSKEGISEPREANVYRLAQVSGHIIDQCVAQGVPFAREYGGMLANRSFGGAQVSRTFYARGQNRPTASSGSLWALMRQVKRGALELFTNHEMLNLIADEGRAQGIVCS